MEPNESSGRAAVLDGPGASPPAAAPRLLMALPTTIGGQGATEIARRLQRDHGCSVVIVANGPGDVPGDLDPSAFADFVYWGEVIKPRRPGELGTAAELAASAERLEKHLDISALDLLRSDRHVGIEFVTGATFMRSLYASNLSFAQRLDLALRACEFAEQVIQRHRPEATIGFPGGFHWDALISVGEALGVPMHFLAMPRRDNNFYWLCNRWGWPAGLEEAFETEFAALKAADPDMLVVNDANLKLGTPDRVQLVLDALKQTATIGAVVRQLMQVAKAGAISSAIRRLRGRDPAYGSYRTLSKMRQVLGRWIRIRSALRQPPLLDTLPSDLPFVFYPLQFEPESSLMVEAQAAESQLSFIDWLVKTVPAGWYVMVKDHPLQPAERGRAFWRQLDRYPNLLVAPALEPSEVLMRRARAVAVINSTVGIQAALLGIPVLTFHDRYTARLMPHVWYANSYQATRQALREIRDGKGPDSRGRRLSAQAYLNAFARFEFPITNPVLLGGGRMKSAMQGEEFDAMYEALVRSLQWRRANHAVVIARGAI